MKRNLTILLLFMLLTSCEEIIELSFNARCEVVSVSDPWLTDDGTAQVRIKVKNRGSNEAINVYVEAVLYENGRDIDSDYKSLGSLRAKKTKTVVLTFGKYNTQYLNDNVTVKASVDYDDSEIFPDDDDDDCDCW